MSFQVLKTAKMSIVVFWLVTPCGITDVSEDGSCMFHRNVCNRLFQIHGAEASPDDPCQNVLLILTQFISETFDVAKSKAKMSDIRGTCQDHP